MHNHRKSSIGVILCVLFLMSCSQNSEVVNSQVQDLETKVSSLEAEVKQLKEQMSMNEMFKDWEKIAFMTPGADGYSLIKSDLGTFTVSLSDIQPYANGSKITLQFGNLTSATIDGLKAKLEWGSLDKAGLPDNQAAKSREIVFNESLRSGSWTNAQVVLEGIPPVDLGFVRLRDVGHRGVRLHK